MSGGHYDYLCFKLEETNVVRVNEPNITRKVFQDLLQLVAKAMHDIEWVDSGDYAEGEENEAIINCLQFGQENTTLQIKAALYDELQKIFNQGRAL